MKPVVFIMLVQLFFTLCACSEHQQDLVESEASVPEAYSREVEAASVPRKWDAETWEGRYETLFTNPVCPERAYRRYNPVYDGDRMDAVDYPSRDATYALDASDGVPTLGGGVRYATKKNVYCTGDDMERSAVPASMSEEREFDSPHVRLLQWINGTLEGDEIFFASLSFSSGEVTDALCEAAKRKVKVGFALNGLSSKGKMLLEDCASDDGTNYVTYSGQEPRTGSSSSRLAHMKTFIIEHNHPDHRDAGEVYITFQSANVSSGTALHHENWNFVRQKRDTYFVQNHLCLKESLLAYNFQQNVNEWRAHLKECRANIPYEGSNNLISLFHSRDRRRQQLDQKNRGANRSVAGSVGRGPPLHAHRYYQRLDRAIRNGRGKK